MERIWQDLRYAVRMLAKNPGFTALAVLSLAIGIGVNSTAFSIIDCIFLRPMPVKDPNQLVWIYAQMQAHSYQSFSYPTYQDLCLERRSFESIAAVSRHGAQLNLNGEVEIIRADWVSENFFSVLGIKPAMGQWFTAADKRDPDGDPPVVISYGLWQRRFGSDRAVVMDLNYTRDTTSGQEGLDLLSQIRIQDDTLPIIVMTAWGTVELAVEAMHRGARDFVQKPWDNARLLTILRTQLELSRALRKGRRLEAENRLLRDERHPKMIASSAVMKPILDLIARIGPSDANVLITGEHGTGKEVVARTLHSISLRSSKPLVIVNAGGLSEGVFESELFGHVKGSFTDAKSDRRR